ncbi:MAG: threonylcarbamoyl-AMP synthase [Betaproteobacteria bacterium]|nr:threonylcarbamoyl-AMP synthase [Betaproteobacteria bacterium]MBK9605669.1 threonylcarbamoyl-AMP synthase [Betaproteobacteria bacterium]
MAQYFSIHPKNPQPRLVAKVAAIVRDGGLIAYPTDSSYALGCHLGDVTALQRIRRIRGLDDKHLLTLVCRDLSEIAKYARVDDWQFRLLKRGTPGGYTFILQATREVPRRLQHPKRSTVGIRVPDHPVALALLAELDEPLLSSTLILPGAAEPMQEPLAIRAALERQLDAVADGGVCDGGATTVIDLSVDPPAVIRYGRGGLAALGLRAPEA